MEKIYDISKGEHQRVGYVDDFRSKQICECTTCLTRTNLWSIDRGFDFHDFSKQEYLRAVVLCPGREYTEHVELDKLLAIDSQLSTKVQVYSLLGNNQYDELALGRVKHAIQEERGIVSELIRVTRALFKPVYDVVGVDPASAVEVLRFEGRSNKSPPKSLRNPEYRGMTIKDDVKSIDGLCGLKFYSRY